MGRVFGPVQGAWVWFLIVVRIAIKLKYRNTPKDTYRYNTIQKISIKKHRLIDYLITKEQIEIKPFLFSFNICLF